MRFPKYTKKRISIAFIFLIIGFFCLTQQTKNTQIISITSPTQTPFTFAKVTKIIDGDTIEISTGQKVRYIGINTPEIFYPNKPNECFALEARKENIKLVEGKTIRLEKDATETDTYGRLLRYVFIDGNFINKILLSEGYARIMTIPPNLKYYSLFKEEELKAKEHKKGLWNQCL